MIESLSYLAGSVFGLLVFVVGVLLYEANVALRERCGILALLLKDAQREAQDAQTETAWYRCLLAEAERVARFRTLDEIAVDDIIEATRWRDL